VQPAEPDQSRDQPLGGEDRRRRQDQSIDILSKALRHSVIEARHALGEFSEDRGCGR
jgi:hypothetical protein